MAAVSHGLWGEAGRRTDCDMWSDAAVWAQSEPFTIASVDLCGAECKRWESSPEWVASLRPHFNAAARRSKRAGEMSWSQEVKYKELKYYVAG